MSGFCCMINTVRRIEGEDEEVLTNAPEKVITAFLFWTLISDDLLTPRMGHSRPAIAFACASFRSLR